MQPTPRRPRPTSEVQRIDLFHHVTAWRNTKKQSCIYTLLTSFYQGLSPSLHIKEPGARMNLHWAVFYNLRTSYLPSPLTKRPPAYGKNAFKYLTASCYLLWENFISSSADRKQPKANRNMWILSHWVLSNISQVQGWSLSKNNSKTDLLFSLLTNLLVSNHFLLTQS